MRCLVIVFVTLVFTVISATALELDETPAEYNEWGYRPAPGASSALNPPGFSWRPCKDAATYHLQVATDDGFAKVVYENPAVVWNAHCPPVTLPDGILYWRYAAIDKHGEKTSWSVVRAFSVADDAIAFPQPTLNDLQQRLPEGHPRLFFRAEDLPRLRELGQGALKKEYDALIAAAEKYLAKPPDTTEPPKYPEGTVRKSEEWTKIWWGNRTKMVALTNTAAHLAFVYQLTGEEKYGLAARDLLLAFAEWDPKGSTNYKYNDEAAMPGLYYPSRTYSWIYPILTEEDRAKIIKVMEVRGRDCYNHLRGSQHLWRPFASHSNRAWHWLGEVAITFQDDIPEAATWLGYAMTKQYVCYPVWSDEDGGWHEGMAYWSSYIGRYIYWADVMRSAFNIDVFERPYFKKAGDYGMYLMPPGTMHGGFADQTTHMKSQSIATLMATLAAASNQPYWKWYADEVGGSLGGGYAGYLRRAHSLDLEAKPPTDLPSSVLFEGVGLAVMNTNLLDGKDNVQIHFKSSPFFGRQSHGYNANNSFLLNINGEHVFRRTGKRDVYGSPHHKDWMWHSQSDNTILVNGEGEEKHSAMARGKILAFHTSPELDVVSGLAGSGYANLDSWKRRILFFKPDVILIHDTLNAPEASIFQWMLHTKGAMEIDGKHVAWTGAPGRVDVDFAYPAGLSISQTDQFDPPPAAWRNWDLGEWHLTAETTDKKKVQHFVTLIRINDAVAMINSEKSAYPESVGLQMPAGLTTLRFTQDHFQVAWPDENGITFDELNQ